MKRNPEIDFLKCIMILLMVCFHLTFASHCFPEVKKLVYTFHMPVFLILSGFMMNVRKPLGKFGVTIVKLLVPYVIMESGYSLMASMLPIAEHIDNLTFGVFLDKVTLHPIGPYWYLHTLILCGVAYFVAMRLTDSIHSKKVPATLAPALALILLWGLSKCGIVSFACSAYFFAGAFMRQTGKEFKYFFRASWIAVPVFLGLCLLPQYHDKTTIVGIIIVYAVMSMCMMFYKILSNRVGEVMLWIGRNTMPIFLFSPIFTILCKQTIPYLPSALSLQVNGLIFIAISLPICVAGSICVDRVLKSILKDCYYR